MADNDQVTTTAHKTPAAKLAHRCGRLAARIERIDFCLARASAAKNSKNVEMWKAEKDRRELEFAYKSAKLDALQAG